MRVGPAPVAGAEGAIPAPSEAVPGGRLRKGAVPGPAQIDALRAPGGWSLGQQMF